MNNNPLVQFQKNVNAFCASQKQVMIYSLGLAKIKKDASLEHIDFIHASTSEETSAIFYIFATVLGMNLNCSEYVQRRLVDEQVHEIKYRYLQVYLQNNPIANKIEEKLFSRLDNKHIAVFAVEPREEKDDKNASSQKEILEEVSSN